MLIAQLSDLHVRPGDQLYGGAVNSNAQLSVAVDHLHSLDRRPDLVIVSGDLVDEGRPEEYVEAAKALGRLAIPFLIAPGNHDDRANLRRAFRSHDYLPAAGPMNYCIDDHDLRIVVLDTCKAGSHHGELEESTLSWLELTLLTNREKPTLVVMHHPPFTCGIPYLDRYRLLDFGKLANLLVGFDNIEAVLCGHVHRTMVRRWAGTVVITCPSTTTEIALQMAQNAQPQSYSGPSSYLLHQWSRSERLVTHLVHTNHDAGPYPFF